MSNLGVLVIILYDRDDIPLKQEAKSVQKHIKDFRRKFPDNHDRGGPDMTFVSVGNLLSLADHYNELYDQVVITTEEAMGLESDSEDSDFAVLSGHPYEDVRHIFVEEGYAPEPVEG